MKLVFISDTHGKHSQLAIPEGDVLIFCGDMSVRGTLNEVENFSQWLKRQIHPHKIVIAGNHDFSFEDKSKNAEAIGLIEDASAIYLNDSGVEIKGIKFWGSPIQPWFYNWAFNRMRGLEIKEHWELIPTNTDVLITHGPPFGILDKIKSGERVGCEELLIKVQEIKPRIHAFGHIHESYGTREQGGIKFINASNLSVDYKKINPPVVIEFAELTNP